MPDGDYKVSRVKYIEKTLISFGNTIGKFKGIIRIFGKIVQNNTFLYFDIPYFISPYIF